jgi:hypothetical protein
MEDTVATLTPATLMARASGCLGEARKAAKRPEQTDQALALVKVAEGYVNAAERLAALGDAGAGTVDQQDDADK